MIKRLGFIGTIVVSGYLGIICFSALFYFVSWLIMKKPPGGGFYGILFPYITHPIGYAIGSLIGAKFAKRNQEVKKPVNPAQSSQKLIIGGSCVSFFAAAPLLFVTGPPLMIACSTIDAICKAFIK